MADRSIHSEGAPALTFEAFGVRVRVSATSPDELERTRRTFPPGSIPCTAADLDASFGLAADGASGYELSKDGSRLARGLRLDFALEALERQIRDLVALEAPAHIFVHAGVVGHRGAAVLLPGESHAGKTTLVSALVRAGATYYSDEYAPIDAAGLVHPYAKPLSIRNQQFVQVEHDVAALGGVAGEEPLAVAVAVVTSYEAGAEWQPRRLSSGEAALALLAHAVPAQTRPAEALRTISRSIERARVLDGTRGEAETVAPLLLAELERTG